MGSRWEGASRGRDGVCVCVCVCMGFPGGSVIKIHLPVQEMRVRSLRWEDPLEKEMASYSSIG